VFEQAKIVHAPDRAATVIDALHNARLERNENNSTAVSVFIVFYKKRVISRIDLRRCIVYTNVHICSFEFSVLG
jgi:hypothetical protein